MIKITQVRDGGNHVTQSTLTLDAWVERMKEEVKTCPVTMFRSQLRHVLPGDHCEAADKLPKMMPAAEFRKTEGGQCMKAYNGLVELTVGPLAGRAEVEQVKREAWKLPQTRCAFMGASGHSVKILVAFTRPDNTLPLTRAEAEAFHAHAYIMAVKCYQPQLSFDIRPKEPFWNNIHAFPMTPMCFTGRTPCSSTCHSLWGCPMKWPCIPNLLSPASVLWNVPWGVMKRQMRSPCCSRRP